MCCIVLSDTYVFPDVFSNDFFTNVIIVSGTEIASVIANKAVGTSKNPIISVADYDTSLKTICYGCVYHLQQNTKVIFHTMLATCHCQAYGRSRCVHIYILFETRIFPQGSVCEESECGSRISDANIPVV